MGILLPNSSTDSFYKEMDKTSGVSVSIPAIQRKHQVDITDIQSEPVYTLILIDKSGSMHSYAEKVASGYSTMISNLRKSGSTKSGCHFITLALFSTDYEVVQEAIRLSPIQGKDEIKFLEIGTPPNGNYYPHGGTALYDSLFEAFSDVLQILEMMENEGFMPQLNIALISDGKDNQSRRDPVVLRNLLTELRKKEYLKSSVVLGLLDKDFTTEMLEEIRETVGFDRKISLEKSEKEFRRAFLEASNVCL